MNISDNKVVQMHYELKNDKGEVLDSSAGKEPLAGKKPSAGKEPLA